MSTPGVIGFRMNRKDMLTYNHMDSYPTYLGKQVMQDMCGVDIVALRKTLQRLKMVDEGKPATWDEQQAVCVEGARVGVNPIDMHVGTGKPSAWYCLLRGLQGTLTPYIKGFPFMMNYNSFLRDSTGCEWAYIVNLDNEMLEIYKGYNHDPEAAGRYAKKNKQGDCGVALMAVIPLADLSGMDIPVVCEILEKLPYAEDPEELAKLVGEIPDYVLSHHSLLRALTVKKKVRGMA